MTRRENTNNLGQYVVLDIRHTIYGSIIGMSLCGFSHNKLKNYVCFFSVVCVSKRWYLLSCILFSHMTGSDVRGSDVIFPALFSYYSSTFWYGKYGWKVSWIVKWYGKYGWKVT
jgi:hypothetical protein